MDFQVIPQNYGRLQDTNRIYFKLYSANYTLPNFRYFINLYVKQNGTFVLVGSIRKRPSVIDGSVIFYPAEILKNYVSSDLNLTGLSINPCYNSNIIYKIGVSEQYMSGRGMISSSLEYSAELMGFNGVQEYIPYTNPLEYVMTSGTTGRFLTDSLMSYVDPIENSFLYFLTASGDTKPTKAEITISYVNELNKSNRNIITNYSQSSPGSLSSESGKTIYDYTDDSWSGDIDTFDFDIEHTGETYMWSIPTGPQQLSLLGYFDTGKTWSKYKINLTKKSLSGDTIFNLEPYIYYRKCKNNKWRNYEIFWRNPHGGFDSHLFYMKNGLQYNIERKLYEKRLDYNYSMGDRGTTTYNIKTKETYNLKSDYITQNQYQLLTQLVMSPEVYLIYYYNNTKYNVPVIITDDQIEYKYIDQDKMISMSVNITPSFTKSYK